MLMGSDIWYPYPPCILSCPLVGNPVKCTLFHYKSFSLLSILLQHCNSSTMESTFNTSPGVVLYKNTKSANRSGGMSEHHRHFSSVTSENANNQAWTVSYLMSRGNINHSGGALMRSDNTVAPLLADNLFSGSLCRRATTNLFTNGHSVLRGILQRSSSV